MIKLGDTIELTIEEARAKAIEIKKHNHTTSTNPQEPQIDPITFKEFYDNYYLAYIQTHVK